MPLYEYECDACHTRFEVIQRFSDAPPDTCRSCGKGPVRRLMSSPAIQFKGTGWYITDYAQKGKSSASESPAASTNSDSKESSASSSDSSSKSDAKPAASPATTPAKTD